MDVASNAQDLVDRIHHVSQIRRVDKGLIITGHTSLNQALNLGGRPLKPVGIVALRRALYLFNNGKGHRVGAQEIPLSIELCGRLQE